MQPSDFTTGVLTALGAAGAYQIYKLFCAPSVEYIESIASKPIPQLGDNATITVWGFETHGQHPRWNKGVSDSSPYVSRVEAYLRLIQKPYTKAVTQGLAENPRTKVPFANLQGLMVDDSSRILETIRNSFQVTIDNHLNEDQTTKGYLVRSLLFGSLYYVLLAQAFGTNEGRQRFERKLKQTAPPVIGTLICKFVFRSMYANLKGANVAQLPRAEIVKRGQNDARVLSRLLGTNQYLLGTDQPTSYDADLYAFLAILVCGDFEWMESIMKECPNLEEYVARMRAILYPEIPT